MRCRLEDIASILGDGLHGTPKYDENGEFYFINGNNLKNGEIVIKPETKRVSYNEYTKYRKNLTNRTIFISINGTLGNIAVYKGEKVILGKSACYFNVKDEIDRDFIRYVVSTDDFQEYIRRYANGTTIKNVSLRVMRDYEFNLPPLETQRAIAAILSALDAKIDNNTKINNHLEKIAQAIFKSWFVDFEPWGGVMPNDWREGTLSEICHYSSERISVSSLTLDTYISTENMSANKSGFMSATSLPTTSQTTAFFSGDTLVSNIRPYFKKIVYCDFAGGCSTDVLCFHPQKDNFSLYVYNVLFCDSFFDFMVAGCKGTKMPRGDKQQIMSYPVIIPTDVVLNDFINTVAPVNKHRLFLNDDSNQLAVLRDTLLPRLMSGELSIADLEEAK